jgi:hypothetical protein
MGIHHVDKPVTVAILITCFRCIFFWLLTKNANVIKLLLISLTFSDHPSFEVVSKIEGIESWRCAFMSMLFLVFVVDISEAGAAKIVGPKHLVEPVIRSRRHIIVDFCSIFQLISNHPSSEPPLRLTWVQKPIDIFDHNPEHSGGIMAHAIWAVVHIWTEPWYDFSFDRQRMSWMLQIHNSFSLDESRLTEIWRIRACKLILNLWIFSWRSIFD